MNKILKKTYYFLGEVSVVIIGIVPAVQLNNMSEKRKNKEEGEQSLKRIATELTIDK